MTPEQRFLLKINIPDDPRTCWEWQASLIDGYGGFWYKGKTFRSNRFAYLMFNGELEKGKDVLHSCNNRKCCNPNHLRLGTNQENVNDKMRAGRQAKGLMMPNARKTHCKHGHEFTVDNTIIRKDGRECRTCKKTYYKRKKSYTA